MSYLSRATLIRYSLPAIPMAIPTLPVFILLPVFYHEYTGLKLSAVGLALLLSRLLDAASDVLAARWCDHSLWGLGRRHGWILTGGLLATPGLLLLFNPPPQAGFWWLLLSSSLLYFGWTLIQIPYQAWLADLSQRDEDRLTLSSWREAGGLLGLLLSAALPWLLAFYWAETHGQLQGLSLITLGIATICFWGLWRLPTLPASHKPFQWRGLTRLNGFWRINGSWGINGIANGITATLFPLAITVGFDRPESDRNSVLFLYFLSACVGIVLIKYISRFMRTASLWSLSILLSALFFLPVPWLQPTDYGLFLGICLTTGIFLAADLVLPPLLQAQLIDQDRASGQQDRPAVFFACHNIIYKLALGLGTFIATALISPLSQIFYSDDINPHIILMIYAGLACVLKAIAGFILWNLLPVNQSHQ